MTTETPKTDAAACTARSFHPMDLVVELEFARELENVSNQVRKHAQIVAQMLELGDQRLMAHDGPIGGQLPDLSPDEWGEVYRACKAITTLK